MVVVVVCVGEGVWLAGGGCSVGGCRRRRCGRMRVCVVVLAVCVRVRV